MRIDRLSIINFKNFTQVDVDFSSEVNLIVGGNGSGKTSILEAINVAVGCFFSSQEQKLQRVIEFSEVKITDGIREPYATVKADSVSLGGMWSRTMKRDTKTNDIKDTRLARDFGKTYFDKFDNPEDRTVAPLIVYYSTQRLFRDAYLSGRQKYDAANGRRNGYLQCLKESAIKSVLNEWLGNAVTRRATLRIKDIEQVDLVLENVESAIKKTLSIFLNIDQDSLKIYQEPDSDNELFVRYDAEHDLPISYYSDGFRNILYLIIDLVWRSSQLNPWLTLDEISSDIRGVVTIDEIDLHLHPKWQAKAVSILQVFFPRVQFFITTHSPTVVANFENGALYVIDSNQVERHDSKFFGKQVNSILRNVLGASDRHVPTQMKLDKLFELIDRNMPDEYNPLLDELKDVLGLEDIDINKALALIEWQESVNQNQ